MEQAPTRVNIITILYLINFNCIFLLIIIYCCISASLYIILCIAGRQPVLFKQRYFNRDYLQYLYNFVHFRKYFLYCIKLFVFLLFTIGNYE